MAAARRTTRHQQRGFTLVELLTVLVIIGLLAAILMPRFARARFVAQFTACQGNMNTVAKAVNLYANDNGQQLPSSLTLLTTATSGTRPYLPNKLNCPSNGASYTYAYSTGTLFTLYCQGVHSTVVSDLCGAGYPQYVTSGIVLK